MFGGMRIFIGVIFAIGVVAPAIGAQATVPGWYTETRVSGRAVGERAAAAPPPADYTIRIWTTEAAARVEGGIPVPGGAKDAYLVSRPAERRGYQVIPSQRSIRVLDNRAIMAMSPVDFRMADSAGVTVKELGDGGVILGHKTTKRRVTIELRGAGGPRPGGRVLYDFGPDGVDGERSVGPDGRGISRLEQAA